MSEIQENILILKCKSGDTSAFKRLIDLYRRQLFSYLFRLCSSREDAEDLFQDTLVKVWGGINQYNEQQKFASWLFTIAHNTAIDNFRVKKKKILVVSTEPDELQSSSDPYVDYTNKEVIMAILEIVEALSMKQKEVFFLRFNSGLSFKEIANITGEPLNTVLSHMNYSIQKIKRKLGKKND